MLPLTQSTAAEAPSVALQVIGQHNYANFVLMIYLSFQILELGKND